MFWPLGAYRLMHPKERHIWAQVRILHETEKAISADNDIRIWLPKSDIHSIRLKNNIFEIYVRESTGGQQVCLHTHGLPRRCATLCWMIFYVLASLVILFCQQMLLLFAYAPS